MDPFERFEDREAAFRTALSGRQATIWTALPGIIQSFDPASLTVEVQPAIQATFTGPDLQTKTVSLPLHPDVPVLMPGGGSYVLTMPVTQGDECLIVYASRCIDNWWDQGGVQTAAWPRQHDLSDGFALLRPWSQKAKFSNYSTTTTQLRTNDGTMIVEIDQPNGLLRLITPNATMVLNSQSNEIDIMAANINITGNVNITGVINGKSGSATTMEIAGNVAVTGAIAATGEISTTVASAPVNLSTHRTTGVQTGPGISGPPELGT